MIRRVLFEPAEGIRALKGLRQRWHHTGRAVDIATPGVPPLTEAFERSDAFRWLEKNATNHGFSMSYPRGNALGYVYEPWHWCRQPG